jgi:hypothetical protein
MQPTLVIWSIEIILNESSKLDYSYEGPTPEISIFLVTRSKRVKLTHGTITIIILTTYIFYNFIFYFIT